MLTLKISQKVIPYRIMAVPILLGFFFHFSPHLCVCLKKLTVPFFNERIFALRSFLPSHQNCTHYAMYRPIWAWFPSMIGWVILYYSGFYFFFQAMRFWPWTVWLCKGCRTQKPFRCLKTSDTEGLCYTSPGGTLHPGGIFKLSK